jgi:hypothetical protein
VLAVAEDDATSTSASAPAAATSALDNER